MASIARTTEYMTVTVVVLLLGSCLLSACSSTPQETTGSIAPTQAPASAYYAPPPVINNAATIPAAAQPVAYAPQAQPVYAPQRQAYAPRQRQAAVCPPVAPRKNNRNDITASIPRAQTAPRSRAPQMSLVAHIIEPRETMQTISRRFNTRTADIAAVNRINPTSQLHAGEIIVVPFFR